VLLNKLSALGIVDHELVWFEDYLHNRNQIVGYQGVYSYLTSGVPQGSILVPLLFVLYVNDLPSVVHNCKILMYADDTVLFYPDSDVAVTQQKLNDDLELIGTGYLIMAYLLTPRKPNLCYLELMQGYLVLMSLLFA
jgi:hypothetical protein